MTSIVCAHCDAKIRLTRKKSKPKPPEQPSGNSQATDETPPRLPVPDFFNDNEHVTDAVDPDPRVDEPQVEQVDDLPKIKTRRKRRSINLDGFESDEPSESRQADLSELTNLPEPTDLPEPSQLPDEADFPNIRTRRKKVRLSLDQLDEAESASPDFADISTEPKSVLRNPLVPDTSDAELPETVAEPNDASRPKPKIEIDLADDLLPPKFLVPDIEADVNAVVLPTAGGGLQVVDKTEVRVMHEGQSVKLVSLSPEELKRVRLIENLVALVIAAIMLAVAVWLLL